jgi:hypothetical protein
MAAFLGPAGDPAHPIENPARRLVARLVCHAPIQPEGRSNMPCTSWALTGLRPSLDRSRDEPDRPGRPRRTLALKVAGTPGPAGALGAGLAETADGDSRTGAVGRLPASELFPDEKVPAAERADRHESRS